MYSQIVTELPSASLLFLRKMPNFSIYNFKLPTNKQNLPTKTRQVSIIDSDAIYTNIYRH